MFTWTTLAVADEGQWTPAQIHELDANELRQRGLELEPKDLWSDGQGLMRAAVNLSGCSAAFVSATGLVATNHHCAYAAIQSQSSTEHNYLADGFLAKARRDELEAKGRTVRVLENITDVTELVREAALGVDSDLARAKAVERIRKELVKACEGKDPAFRCSVGGFYHGSRYELFQAIELRDVRLVYAPPSSIGEYGGEVDNWMWPRHTGDFTLVRAYVGPDGKPADFAPENVPYEPEKFLAVSPDGVEPGSFVAVLGYPGRTDRYLPAPEVRRYLEQVFPKRIEIYGEWIEILERLGAQDPAVKIKVASNLKSLANRHKNARGMVDGISRMELLSRRQAEDEQLGKVEGGNVLAAELAALSDDRRRGFDREFLLGALRYGPGTLAIAVDLVRRAKERIKPDLERESQYMERNAKRLWERQEKRLRDFDAGVDMALAESLLTRFDALPNETKVRGTAGVRAQGLVRRTRLSDSQHVQTLWDAADWDALKEDSDPMIALARSVVDALEANEETKRARDGKMLELGPRYFAMLEKIRSGPIYPDANGTLRFSYASVQGYSPRDGLVATPHTTLAGAIDKHTGTYPFDVPEVVRGQAAEAGASYWADPDLGDVPICFLSNADTTGGNSGSPVINGKGQLVGLNFDRVWENIAGDFGYNAARSRNVSVDIRYMLWLLDRTLDASSLLDELGVTKFRKLGPRKKTAPAPARPVASARLRAEPADVAKARGSKPSDGSKGCTCAVGSSASGFGAVWACALLGFGGYHAHGRRRHR